MKDLGQRFASLFFCFLCLHVSPSCGEDPRFIDYCVVGAGPSGLQMGYFLERAGRDYVVFERSNVSGAFFTQFPRHDTLISINKRHTGKTNKEFNLRHDWNSLISDDESLLFKHYSKEMFPHRAAYVKYLNDYQQKLGIKVQHNTDIRNLRRTDDSDNFMMEDQRGTSYECNIVVIAIGTSEPNKPKPFKGIEYTESYETAPIDADNYEGQSVLIIGRGNSAMEFADRIYGSTNVVHTVARGRIKLAWQTHYVGDIRAVNNGLLDTYQLKSLDGALEASTDDMAIEKDEEGKLWIKFAEDQSDDLGIADNFAMRDPYDRVILCTGFKFNTSMFDDSAHPEMCSGKKSKYPRINHLYASMNVQNMFFAGTNTHSLDYRKSAGAFIHGFRYTARVLHHYLEWYKHSIPWPAVKLPITELLNSILKRLNEGSGIYQMFQVLGDAIIVNEDGTEFEYLEEIPIFRIFSETFHKSFGRQASRLFVVVLEYGPYASGPGKDVFSSDRATGEPSEGHTSNFLHPVIYYYNKLPSIQSLKSKPKEFTLPVPSKIHHIVEDFTTLWDGSETHVLPFRRFLEQCLKNNLRHYFAEECFQYAMSGSSVPPSCRNHFMNGDGLTAGVFNHGLRI